MEIIIKPYSHEYAKQCADLEQYLWKEDKHEREICFDWTYTNCPNHSQPLCVIAVNENDEVMGFRGYFLNKFVFAGQMYLVAQLSDTVVSDRARRMGIFQKMTNFSLKYLADNKAAMILNLSPSWAPYYGYKKIDFEDLAPFHSKYRFNLWQIFIGNVLKKNRSSWLGKNDYLIEKDGIRFCITRNIDDRILDQVNNIDSSRRIHSSLTFDNLKWRTKRPNRNYIYAYSLDQNEELSSFIIFKTTDFYNYEMGLMRYSNPNILIGLLNCFDSVYKPAIIAAWDFAIDEKDKKMLSKLRMHSIPFINKIRKNPPALLRTLQYDEDGTLNWLINGVDVRKVENWSIHKLDLDSF